MSESISIKWHKAKISRLIQYSQWKRCMMYLRSFLLLCLHKVNITWTAHYDQTLSLSPDLLGISLGITDRPHNPRPFSIHNVCHWLQLMPLRHNNNRTKYLIICWYVFNCILICKHFTAQSSFFVWFFFCLKRYLPALSWLHYSKCL